MSLYLEDNISDIYVGEDKIDSIFLGDDLVYSSGPKTVPLYFEAANPNSVSTVKFYQKYDGTASTSKLPTYTIPTLEYSYDGMNWMSYILNTAISIGGVNSSRVYFRGDNPHTWYSYYNDTSSNTYIRTYLIFESTGQVFSGGYVSSLRSKDLSITNFNLPYCYYALFSYNSGLLTAPELPATSLAEYYYAGMFSNCTGLLTAPELPATSLAEHCYYTMFGHCTGLTTTMSELPATSLAEYCYNMMFLNCTSLTTTPELPATSLADYCYGYMFQNCTSLTTPPELPATNLAVHCYGAMFYNCTSLTTTPELPATSLAVSCYNMMFQNCTSLTNITNLPALTIPDGGIMGTYGSMFMDAVRANSSASGICVYPYRIPTSGTGSTGSKDLNNVFSNLDGSGGFTPSINTTFYISVPSF